jgi:hypothetical protein
VPQIKDEELLGALNRAQLFTLTRWAEKAEIPWPSFCAYRAGRNIPRGPLERLATAIGLPPRAVPGIISKGKLRGHK